MNVSQWFRSNGVSLKDAGIITLASESYALNSNPLSITTCDFGDNKTLKTMFIDGGDPSKGNTFHNIESRVYYQEKIGIPNAMEQVENWFKAHPIVFTYSVSRFTRPFLLKITPNVHKYAMMDIVSMYKCLDSGCLSEALSDSKTFSDLINACDNSGEKSGKGFAIADLIGRTSFSLRAGSFASQGQVPGYLMRTFEVSALLNHILLMD